MFFQPNATTTSKSNLTLPLVNRRQLMVESMDWHMERRGSFDDQMNSIAKTSSPNNLCAPEAQQIRLPHRKVPGPWAQAGVLPRATSPCPLVSSGHTSKREGARSSDSSTCSPSDESSLEAPNDSTSSSRTTSHASKSKSVPKCAVRYATMAREPPNHGREIVLYRGINSRGSSEKMEDDLAIIWESQCSVMDRLAERARNLSISACEGGATPHRDRSPGIRRAIYCRVKPISSSPIPKSSWDTPFPKNAEMHSPVRETFRSRRNRSRSRSPRHRWTGQRKNADDKYRNLFVNTTAGRTYSNFDVANSTNHEPMLMIMDRQCESVSYHSTTKFGTPSLSATSSMETTVTSNVSITLQQCDGPSSVWRLM